MKITELQTLNQVALNRLNEVKSAKTTFDNATNDRRNSFQDLKLLATRVVNAFIVSGISKLAIENAKSINKKYKELEQNP